ncbi:MAG: N(4)-(beta-N-acetylglucosaminyl)-L-asparaginase [Calditrichae bacterium]|nr:N(4)-(beta-N-acetylglucosaminyl)-L-asparaginase [Calditrichia bacterium]
MIRRSFLKTSAFGIGSTFVFKSHSAILENEIIQNGSTPLVISSYNGIRATEKAMEMINKGADALDAVIAGVNIVEEDPEDMTVGFGGLPNEDGVVELDSCCMHGPTHNAGAVGALQNIKTPSKVARLVMERSDHVLLVGKGALRFAKAHGFKETNLLTERAREQWLKWKETRDPDDNWFPPEIDNKGKAYKGVNYTYGTITCLGIDLKGNISGVTTTSGLSYKIAGRIGDSPIIGAGLYVDNEVGACGSTGRGEENLKNLTSFLIVELMRNGMSPKDACMEGIKRVISHAKTKELIKENGRPAFNIRYYALNKQGQFGSASIYGPAEFSVNDGNENKFHPSDYLYEWED